MTFNAGDLVEVIQTGLMCPVKIGDRGTVKGPSLMPGRVVVDYGLESPVHSCTDSIRKVPPPPPQDWTRLCNLTDRPLETSHV